MAKWSEELQSRGDGLYAQQVYSELFTIKAQDVSSLIITDVLIKVYLKTIPLKETNRNYSKLGISQLKIIAYITNMLSSATFGAIKHKGIPNVNYPIIFKLIIEIIRFFILNYKELKKLSNEVKQLESDINLLDDEIKKRGNTLPTYENFIDYFSEINNQYEAFDKFFS